MALGVPAEVLGSFSTKTGKLSEIRLQEFITKVEAIQEYLSDLLLDQAIMPLCIAKFGQEAMQDPKSHLVVNPKIIWKPVIEEDRNQKQVRVLQAWQMNALSRNETREHLGFEPIDEKEMFYNDLQLEMQKDVGELQTEQMQERSKFQQPFGQPFGQKPQFGQPITKPATQPGATVPGGQRPVPEAPKQTISQMPQPPASREREQKPSEQVKTEQFQLKPPLPLSAIQEWRDWREEQKELEVKSNLFRIIDRVRFNLRQGDTLAKDIRSKAKTEAETVFKSYYKDEKEKKKGLKTFLDIVDGLVIGFHS